MPDDRPHYESIGSPHCNAEISKIHGRAQRASPVVLPASSLVLYIENRCALLADDNSYECPLPMHVH